MLTDCQYRNLGREVLKRYPAIARQLIEDLPQFPVLSDPANMERMFEIFCKTRNVPPSTLKKLRPSMDVMDDVHMFTAVILQAYQPALIKDSKTKVRRGILRALAACIARSQNATQYLARQARHRYCYYKDFRSQVDAAYLTIMPHVVGDH